MLWLVDCPTLITIIAAGIIVGLRGLLGWDAVGFVFGDYERVVFVLVGLSAAWQLSRQRFQ